MSRTLAGMLLLFSIATGCKDECPSECPHEVGPSCRATGALPEEPFAQASAELTEIWCAVPGDGVFPTLIEGRCENAGRVLRFSSGLGGGTRVYDAEGNFVADIGFSDIINSGCGGWSSDHDCQRAVVTRVICGSANQVGDPIEL